jgi:2-C-methyl-D-erythritol 4-phosphate cytidylyltransferase
MNIAVILAGGIGSRMESSLPKQFLEIEGKPIIIHTLEKFERSENISGIIIVINKDYESLLRNLLERYKMTKIIKIVSGGETGQLSIYNGLKSLEEVRPELVIIHDAVRPFITEEEIKKMVSELEYNKAVTLGVNIKSTVFEGDKEGFVKRVLPKQSIFEGQSQGFNFNFILKEHVKAIKAGIINYSDDNALIMNQKKAKIKIIEGSYDLIKITTKEDMDIANQIFKRKYGNNN